MTPRYIDAHCHVQFEQYDSDRDALIARMQEEGVAGIVVGCDAGSSQKAVVLAEAREHLYASAGHHPNHTEPFDESAIRAALGSPRTIAVGECGLDYFRPTDVNEEIKRTQKELFKKHLALATEFDKPLIIHARPSKGTVDAYEDLIEILTEAKGSCPNLRGDIHFFVGGIEEAQKLIVLGFTLSFTAVVTFAHDYDGVIKHVPLESILAETDAPYVAPVSRRGQRNDPLSVIDVVNKIAEIRQEDPETVRQALLANTKKFFGI
jgi:TatD DNase family protein